MLVFLVLLVILFTVSESGLDKNGLWLLTCVLSFILGFRGRNVGDDTARYIDNYYGTNYSMGVGHMEPGWQFCSTFFHDLGFSAYFFHFVVALFTLSCFSFVISRMHGRRVKGRALFFLYALGFYLYMFNGMRQFVAIGLCFIAFYEMSKDKVLLSVALVFFASLFHSSALVALFLVPTKWIKLSFNFSTVILTISLVIGVFVTRRIVYVLAGEYAHIIDEHGFRTSMAYVFSVCVTTSLFFMWILCSTPKLKHNYWMKVFFVSVVVQNILCSVVYGPRIVFYFSTAQIVTLSLAYRQTKSYWLKKVIYLYAFVTFFRFLLPELYRTDESLLPYYMTLSFFN